MTLKGAGGQIVQSAANTPIFKVDSTAASNITWDGLWLRGTGGYVDLIYRGEVGIYITNSLPFSTNLVIKNCPIHNCAIGVFGWGVDGLDVGFNRLNGPGRQLTTRILTLACTWRWT